MIDPIYDLDTLARWKELVKKKYTPKHYAYLLIDLNVGLRVSDLVCWKWDMVESVDGGFEDFVQIKEKRTGRKRRIPLNNTCKEVLADLRKDYPADVYVFQSDSARVKNRKSSHWAPQYVYTFLVKSAEEAGVRENVGTHTPRKTFGYWGLETKTWTEPELLVYLGFNNLEEMRKYLCHKGNNHNGLKKMPLEL